VTALVTIIHVLICIILIIAVLLQSGKAADLAGAFGGVGSQTAFGPRTTATILSKVTQVCAILFMLTSLGLWVLSGKESRSAVSGEPTPAQSTAAQTETKPGATPPATQPTTQPATKPEEKKASVPTTPPAAEKQPPAKTETAPPIAPVKK
jgi:preprotein translocase subunit SecG